MILGATSSVAPSDLRGFTRFITKADSTKFTDVQIDALLNLYYHEFINEILKSGSSIDFNMVTEDINLVADEATHSVTGKVLRIKRIEIQWESGGIWYPVTFFDISEDRGAIDTTHIAAKYSKTKPYADLYLADEILKIDIFPIPAVSNTGGMKVWKSLEVTELTTAASEPSIPEAYQKYLAWGAIRAYFLKKEMFTKAAEAEKEMLIILNRAISFYASRNEEESYMLESGIPDDYGD